MLSFNPCMTHTHVYFLCILSFLSLTAHVADGVYLLKQVCANTSFTPNTNPSYQSNLNSLLSSLSSNATHNLEFYNATAGLNTANPVYGLYLCRGDVTADICRECVATATKEISNTCSTEKVAVTWYDECMLRYSNKSIFSTVDEDPRFALLNTGDISEQDRFKQLLAKMMNDSATEASKFPTGAKKFVTKEVYFSEFQTVYKLVQCTPDLSGADCERCLGIVIGRLQKCCGGKQGGRVLNPSCNVRYELYPFYRTVEAPTPEPAVLPSPPPESKGKSQISSKAIIAIIVSTIALVAILSTLFCYYYRSWIAKKKYNSIEEEFAGNEITTAQSLEFDLGTVKVATSNFSDENKIGAGGFGSVYKGLLSNGQEIAVKRLSKSSGQGGMEFKNEVLLVAKLQHVNLVRLLGFCLEGEETILIYEFVPNKSLDYFLFDPERQGELDWSRRYKIIRGIARGILYLHEDSRLRIIHRDLKPSNVLLDEKMNPKISDFGMARAFEVDQGHGITRRVVGTYGYMSPEYALHGQFSVKSDVFSFGVLILEIISGKKNSLYESDYAEDLLSFAWKNWRDATPLEVMDPTLTNSCSKKELTRCVHIGLLCVQEDPADRPTMATLVVMLNSPSVTLPLLIKPPFFARSTTMSSMPTKEFKTNRSTSKSIPFSVNEVSITELHPR